MRKLRTLSIVLTVAAVVLGIFIPALLIPALVVCALLAYASSGESPKRTPRIALAFCLCMCFLAARPSHAQVVSGATPTISPNMVLGGASYGTFTVYGTSLTTVTLGIQGTNDNVHWFALNSAAITAAGTLATTQTVTTTGLFIVNLSGLTGVRFVTSGTFTGTSASVRLVVSANKGLL